MKIKPKILVIDDDIEIRTLIDKIFRESDYELFFATNGKIGLELLAQVEPVLILLDLVMPIMDGYQFLKKINPKATDPYFVIILSGKGDDVKLQEYYETGLYSFLRKPFGLHELRGVVKRSIEQKQLEHMLEGKVKERTLEFKREAEDRKKAEKELQAHRDHLEELLKIKSAELYKREKLYHNIFDNVPVGLFQSDNSGKILAANQHLVKLFGFPNKDTLLSTNVINLYFDSRNRTGVIKNLKQKEHADVLEVKAKKFDGTAFWVRIDESAFKSNLDQEYFFQGSIMDISEQKYAEEELRRQKAFFESIFNAITDALIIYDTSQRIIMCNPAFTEMFGYRQEEVQGKKARILYANKDEYEKQHRCHHKGDFEDKLKSSYMDCKRKNKTVFPGEMVGTVIKDTESKVVGFMAIIRDITEIKKNELHRQQLIQTEKMASLGIMVSGVAHEINNPNNFIMLNLPLLRMVWNDIVPILKEKYSESGNSRIAGMPFEKACEVIPNLMKGIEEGTNRIRDIVRDLKDYSRHDVTSVKTEFDINKALRASTTILSNFTKKSTKLFNVKYGKDLPMLRGDVRQIEQVIINLIQNACQALPSRDSSVEVSTYFIKKTNSVVLEVKDDGTGIPEDIMKNITDPFFTTKRDKGGTGLGLSISLGIVKEHDGDLVFDSQENKGTVVKVVLPVPKNTKDMEFNNG